MNVGFMFDQYPDDLSVLPSHCPHKRRLSLLRLLHIHVRAAG